ncbi:MAG TPA: ribosome maturation factor RimM [Clostridia bacterium]|nr:ribosome maturation factor RimM [Clostridia bacterium]
MLLVAKGIKAHGIRGDIKINCLMDTPVSFNKLKEVIVKDTTYKVEKVRQSGAFLLLKLEGVETLEQAEQFRGADIFCEREKMPVLQEGVYYIDDLIGSQIMLEKKEIGILAEILQYGSADIYVINTSNGSIMFPFVNNVIEKMDTEAHIIYLDKDEFEKVAVYED